ncbi:MAG: DUF1848 family protein [candidate division Zixibacteria bacterium]|nr:DUF1848 family protein [candidate division Zixibacteria bacterium]
MRKYRNVISASRRCDLVAHYPDYLCQSLSKLEPEDIHTIVLWTKNPLNILTNDQLNRELGRFDNIYLLLTLTGLGGSILEPNVPNLDDMFKMLPALVERLKTAEHIAIRYDPLIHIINPEKTYEVSNITEKTAIEILENMRSNRISRFITSIAQDYKKAELRLKKHGLRFHDHYKQEAEEFIRDGLSKMTWERNILLSCCVSPNLTNRGCIDSQILKSIHPLQLPASRSKDRSQREYCNCIKSYDIGQWYSCPHGCLYCYGNPAPAFSLAEADKRGEDY